MTSDMWQKLYVTEVTSGRAVSADEVWAQSDRLATALATLARGRPYLQDSSTA